jgi:hypothetical protein
MVEKIEVVGKNLRTAFKSKKQLRVTKKWTQ